MNGIVRVGKVMIMVVIAMIVTVLMIVEVVHGKSQDIWSEGQER